MMPLTFREWLAARATGSFQMFQWSRSLWRTVFILASSGERTGADYRHPGDYRKLRPDSAKLPEPPAVTVLIPAHNEKA